MSIDYVFKSRQTTKIKSEKIQLEFSIRNAQSGSYLIQAKLNDQQTLDYKSEVKNIDSTQNINFQTNFDCYFCFEKQQNLLITIYKNNNAFQIINTTLGCIIGSISCTYKKNFSQNESLVIKAKKYAKEEYMLNVKIKLKEKNADPNFFAKNKIYYAITANNNQIDTSSDIKKNGSFESNQIPIHLLQPGYTVSFFYSYNNKLVHKYDRSIQQLENQKKFKTQISLPNNISVLLEDNSEIIINYTLINYIKSGVNIALSIGIDFTGSNGHPKDYLHSHHSLKGPNAYERAITSCGKILGNYDYDQRFPVYGFGAIVNSSNSKEASMCFNLNFSENPEIHTIDNIIKIYHDCLEKEKLTFSEPTYFTPLIKKVISRINEGDIHEYHILLILTDGVIDDLQQTIDILVEASTLPLSVIIVGIGKADFKNMKILDGDEIPLTSSKGEERMRDLVQFVPFSKYQNNAERLSMEVLAEIPRQIVEYYQYKKLNPSHIEAFTQTRRVIRNVNINNNLKAHLQSEVINYTKNFESEFVENSSYFDALNQRFKNNNINNQFKGNFSNRLNININNKSNNNATNTLNNISNSNISYNSDFKNFNVGKNSFQNTSKVNIANQNNLTNKYGNFNQSNFNNQYNQFYNNNNFNNRPYNQSKNIIMNNKININPNNINSNLIIGGYNTHNDTTKKVINKINKP